MTMRDRDRAYYRARAEEEIEAAHAAPHPEAARAHYVLAAHYLDLAHNPEPALRASPADDLGDAAAASRLPRARALSAAAAQDHRKGDRRRRARDSRDRDGGSFPLWRALRRARRRGQAPAGPGR